MLKKFLWVKHVGRFQNYGASGDTELKKYNLFFAENGRGKTTLCAILRSLQSGEPEYVIGRKTLGAADSPNVAILTDKEQVAFRNGNWSATVPDIAVFDSIFVSENIYSGDSIDIEHKRSLYKIIVGKQGVHLARRIDDLDAASRGKSADIRAKEIVVQGYAPTGFPAVEFLHLKEDPSIAAKIIDQSRRLESIRQADLIRSKPELSLLDLPELPVQFGALLRRGIDQVAVDAERLVTAHLSKHQMQGGEAWLGEGLGFVADGCCPFCGQPLVAASDLLAAFRAYFSEAYDAMRAEIRSMRAQVEQGMGDRAIAAFERTVDQNNALVEFWQRFCEFTAPSLPALASRPLSCLRDAALTLIDRKGATPLEAIEPDEVFQEARGEFELLAHTVAAYNLAVGSVNAAIADRKGATANSNLMTEETALTRLKAIECRHTPEAKHACQDLDEARSDKKVIEEEKATTREKLDAYTKDVIGKYQETMNRLLREFHVGFRLTETKHSYPGGVASSSYQILINDTPVSLGDSKTPLDRPCFRNTLSSGDKSTLALAFFLAQIEHDPQRSDKLVVFDDPFNSQDGFRRDCTISKIKKIGKMTTQVIVFSHDLGFLKRMWDLLSAVSSERKCLKLDRINMEDTIIRTFDIDDATQHEYTANLRVLGEYDRDGAGNPRDVVQKIRLILEAYGRNFGEGILQTDTLGGIIGKVRLAGPAHHLHAALDDLEEINDYTVRYHHAGDSQSAAEAINESELHGYVRRTIDLVGGC